MWKKRIQPGEKVPLKLTAAERKLILEGVLFLDDEYPDTIRETPTGKPVMLTLDALEDFSGYIAANANHCKDKRKEKKLDTVFQKIEDLLGRYTEEDDKPLSIEQARGKIGKAMTDLLTGNDPGVISFRLKSTKKPGELYPLKLTWHQRDSLMHCTRIKNKIKERLKEAEEGTQIIGFNRKELDHLNDEVGQAAVYAPSPHKKRLVAVLHRVAELFASDRVGLFGEETPKTRKTAPKKGDLLYQFKITLLDIKPAIWRRIQVRDCTLVDLHEYIQMAFGWENYHLHQFEIDGERYSQPTPDGDDFDLDFKDESDVLLSKLIPKSGRKSRWIYEYDFGDDWRHEVLFEGYPPAESKVKYPLCVEGARACPPEDVGGPWGYAEYLEAMADPQHERHEEFMEWCGPFDPEAFDANKATREMRKAKSRR